MPRREIHNKTTLRDAAYCRYTVVTPIQPCNKREIKSADFTFALQDDILSVRN